MLTRLHYKNFWGIFREFKYCESAISCMLNVSSWNRDVMAAVVWWWIYIKLYNQYMSTFLASSQLKLCMLDIKHQQFVAPLGKFGHCIVTLEV
jgi:hypothetical protein